MNTDARLSGRFAKAVDLLTRGDPAGAEHECLVLLDHGRTADVLHLLGLCRMQQQRPREAVEAFVEAVRANPDEPQLLHDLGRAFSYLGEWLKAAEAYVRAIDLDPGRAENYLYLGPIYEQVNDVVSAERAYRRALECDPKLATAMASLAALYEKTNRLADAEGLTDAALEVDPEDVVANLTRAQLDNRKGAAAPAAERLERVMQKQLSPWNRAIAAERLGTAYEALGRYDSAFATFQAGKQVLRSANPGGVDTGLYSLQTIERLTRHVGRLLEGRSGPSEPTAPAPVFLVGFPRSGTTLLDQILSSHPGIVVLEERDVLRPALQEHALTEAGMEHAARLDADARRRHQTRYWQAAEKLLEQPLAGRLLVDKLPLYTIFIPLITNFFPSARFIFAVRDPRDVVLSCFTRSFGLNEAMRHFLSLESTAAYYGAVMDLGIASLEAMPDRMLRLRYEALVADPEAETRRLCTFLDLEWREELLRFYDTAKRRRINTPSYQQVTQPIYKDALARWRHYSAGLAPVLGRLQPYIDYFGYGR